MRAFLALRGIELPQGDLDDPPSAETIHGLGERKNEILLQMIREDGVEPYAGSVRYLEAALAGAAAGRAGGFACVVGVDRVGHAGALREHGATIIVRDLVELLESP